MTNLLGFRGHRVKGQDRMCKSSITAEAYISTVWHRDSLLSSLLPKRLPCNLTPTTRECVHLVTRAHFRSCDTDGGHTIRSAISGNPVLHANFMALCFIQGELLTFVVIEIFDDLFASGTLTLTFVYEPDPYSLEIHRMCKYELFTSRLSKVIL